ncbi:TIGR02679 family protein [Citricoccus sp. NPDC079358]|uniref:TIGR02679 family protein n=1 Tax=Citricoccus sp. NPDC079358 TaxID=3154653 RepID=UPI00344CEA1E
MTGEDAGREGHVDESEHPPRPGNRAALERLLGVDAMAWFVARARGRILEAGNEPLRGVVQLRDPTPEQRAAAVRLVGAPKRAGAALRVDLAVVEEILRRGPWPPGLADAIETLSGPVVDRSEERARDAAAWEAARDLLAPEAARFPHLAQWWTGWCAAGGLKRAARAEASRTATSASAAVGAGLVVQLAAVLEKLPSAELPLAILAREALGDAHGLDGSRPLGRLAAAVVRVAFVPVATERELSARDSWAAAGVVLSNVASTVLCLGVPGAAGDPAASAYRPSRAATAATLEAMRTARMPVVLTLDQVRSGGVRQLPPASVLHVCENPTVVEVVAERWARSVVAQGRATPSGNEITPGSPAMGAISPVLVCTSGQPSAAVVELLGHLSAAGAEVRYHGDFDWAGLRIARSLSGHVTWTPWRFTGADYRAAVRERKPSIVLTGRPAESPWDPELAASMAQSGLAIEEEAVAELLAADVLADHVR